MLHVIEGGKSFIYKVQSAPSVEAEFYRQARSSLLVTAQILPVDGRQLPCPRLAASVVGAGGVGSAFSVIIVGRRSERSCCGGVQRLHVLLQIGWLAQCTIRWFPPGVQHYDGQIAQLIGILNSPN